MCLFTNGTRTHLVKVNGDDVFTHCFDDAVADRGAAEEDEETRNGHDPYARLLLHRKQSRFQHTVRAAVRKVLCV